MNASDAGPYTTKELSPRTWPDFERLFSQGHGCDFCACMVYQRGCHLPSKEFPTRAESHVRNLTDKRELVMQGRAHGILVFADAEPVGWCQYGPVDELPLPGASRLQKGVRVEDSTSQWRITCFVTHQKHRRRGVGSLALTAAVESIERQGGGWVEATPIAHSYSDNQLPRLAKAYGRHSPQVEEYLNTQPWPELMVCGVGRVPAARGSFGNTSHSGTVSMFERAGFEAVRIVRDTHVLMRRHV
jgi:GNAT superfamily N-acetyltransferase